MMCVLRSGLRQKMSMHGGSVFCPLFRRIPTIGEALLLKYRDKGGEGNNSQGCSIHSQLVCNTARTRSTERICLIFCSTVLSIYYKLQSLGYIVETYSSEITCLLGVKRCFMRCGRSCGRTSILGPRRTNGTAA